MAKLLPDERVSALWQELIAADLASRRATLVSGIDPHVIGSIIDNHVPNDRIINDLRKLNDDGWDEPDKPPLLTYLINAQRCVHPKRLVLLTETIRKLRNDEPVGGPAHLLLLTRSESTDWHASARLLAEELGTSWRRSEELLKQPYAMVRAPDRDVAVYVAEALRRLAVDARAIRCPIAIEVPRVRVSRKDHLMLEIPDPCSPPTTSGAAPGTLWCGVQLITPAYYRTVIPDEPLDSRETGSAQVSFAQAVAFCNQLSVHENKYRLPTELEYQWLHEHTLGLLDPTSPEWLGSRARVGPKNTLFSRIAGFRLIQPCISQDTSR